MRVAEEQSGSRNRPERDPLKIYNERIKLLASLFNTLGIALIVSAFIIPVVREGDISVLGVFGDWVWLVLGGGLHLWAQIVLGMLRKER